MKTRKELLPVLALLVASAIWGSTFIVIKDLVNQISPYDMLGVRYVITSVIMAVMFFPILIKADKDTWRHGMIVGLVFGVGQVFQTVGISLTDASTAGFITGMYIIIIPLLMLIMYRIIPNRFVLISTALALTGMGILSLKGWHIGWGELIVLGSAGFFALHMILLGRWSTERTSFQLTIIQIFGLTLVSVITAAPGGVEFPHDWNGWMALIYLIVFASVLAIFIQTWAQSKVSPTRTGVVMATEPVFAAAFAIQFGGEHLTTRMVLGGALILMAMIVSELRPSHGTYEDRLTTDRPVEEKEHADN